MKLDYIKSLPPQAQVMFLGAIATGALVLSNLVAWALIYPMVAHTFPMSKLMLPMLGLEKKEKN